jgi:hypothetical protein
MHSLFEPTAADEIISRIQKLQPGTPAQWGKMNVSQMMAHCQAPFDAFFGEKKMKRGLMGVLFGRMAKKKLFSDKPWPKNLPTAKQFLVSDQKDFEKEKARLVGLINRFSSEGLTITSNTHPFFGKLSSQEWGLLHYRHLDHHLNQFGN